MQLLENKFENAGLLKLPPNARDIAEHLLTITPLDKLLSMQTAGLPDNSLLREHKVSVKHWQDIINAVILAKTTYFVINPSFNKEEILYLMKAACLSINRPLNVYSVKEILEMSRAEYPIFSIWLSELAQLLKRKTR